jgi:hypothetical protein
MARGIRAFAIGMSLVCGACYGDLVVVQGTVTELDGTSRTLTVRDERTPNAVASYLFQKAPSVQRGDVVRIAFRREAGGARSVVRLMNVTRSRQGDKKRK